MSRSAAGPIRGTCAVGTDRRRRSRAEVRRPPPLPRRAHRRKYRREPPDRPRSFPPRPPRWTTTRPTTTTTGWTGWVRSGWGGVSGGENRDRYRTRGDPSSCPDSSRRSLESGRIRRCSLPLCRLPPMTVEKARVAAPVPAEGSRGGTPPGPTPPCRPTLDGGTGSRTTRSSGSRRYCPPHPGRGAGVGG